ncbi:TolB family protein [Heyndrickxia sporothermodurans]|uniref:Uncharacterized protein n=1 Tax=Heyndrickxia sporothermodurans TaxID=46224 RepID=A0A150KNM5_9BACI|nr:PD40 domain-containing protein [Heyndrickxia sporothermodurans]KYC97106.1 hypothetical protein B4102_0761 [Heyndrickxia sporothermodurans]PTY78454.1 translocation protein TolB [Heyndrickxia sporothermodurans]
MKKKYWIIAIMIGFFLFTNTEPLFAKTESVKIAFIRHTNLWLKVGNKEQQITKEGNVSGPKWSADGKWIAFKKGKELWTYNTQSKKQFRLYGGEASNYQWSPKKNIIAFQIFNDINMIDVEKRNKGFENVASGVGNYSWFPNGKEFLASSISNLLPTGWTSVELYKIPLDAKMNPAKMEHFYTLPKQSSDFFAIQTSRFKWSANGMWIAFLATPTASWSMDNDMLCIIRTDGTNFTKLEDMILNESWFQWASDKNYLAYIGGEGRMAIENKHLNIKILPALKTSSYTPKGFVDWDFTWQDPSLLTVSRAKETEWSNNPKKRPLPSLYKVDTKQNEQAKITSPNKGFGDYHPIYISSINRLTWLRSNRKTTDMWMAKPNGETAKIYIKQIDTVPDYYEKRNWDDVVDIFYQ